MKRTLALILAAVMILALSACGVVQNGTEGSSSPSSTVSGSTNDAPAAALPGASIVLKVSTPESDTNILNTWNCYARVFKNSLEVYSNGEITCDIYPNDQLGDLTSCLEQCSHGTLDICLSPATGNMSAWVPDLASFDIPYLFDDQDALNIMLQGEIFDDINAQLYDKAGLQLLSMFTTGFRNLDSYTKPIYSVSDMKGLKFRLQSIDAHIAMGEAWGAVPTTVAFSELYSAASTGVIDASDNCNYTLFMKNLEEVTKYITDTKHIANVVGAMISTKTLEKLTDEQRAMVAQAADDARRATIGVVQASDVYNTQKLKNAGVELISLTEDQSQEFKDACYDYVCAKVLPTINQDFYDKVLSCFAEAKAVSGK